MKTAREVAHAQEAYYEDCPGPLLPAGKHSPSCDRLTAAIEADRRETVTAVVALVNKYEGGYILEGEIEHLFDAVRSLSPKGTTPATGRAW